MSSTGRAQRNDQANNPTLTAVLNYLRGGISVLPIALDGSKRPNSADLPRVANDTGDGHTPSWKPYQTQRMSEEVATRIWGRAKPPGIATIGGQVSGNLEHLDFDRDAETVFPAWCELVESLMPGLVQRLSVVRTPRQPQGYHVRYRVDGAAVPGNTVLAKLSKSAEPEGDKRVLIETRGGGGYALAPGSPACCHETGKEYGHESGPPPWNPPTITAEERTILTEAAQTFDRAAEDSPVVCHANKGADLRPGDDYNLRGPDWSGLLLPDGWTLARQLGEKRLWCRPGKQKGYSATTGICKGQDGLDLLYVFSSNVAHLEANRCYSKFAYQARVHHAGDFAGCASELRRCGYGGSLTVPPPGNVDGLPVPSLVEQWPAPMRTQARLGLAGCVVSTIEPYSEADPVALLLSFLIGFGSIVGRNAWFEVESTRHHANEFVVFVGRTSKARKGTSWGQIVNLLRLIDEIWVNTRIPSGLVSGEGLIWEVRDPVIKRERVKSRGQAVAYEEVETDPGVPDKRLLVMEGEFANALKAVERHGNTLSPVLRQAWDGVNLRTLAKNSPTRATDPHVSVLGHITAEELRRCLSTTEMANGLGNRHLWLCVRRSKLLPNGGRPDARRIEEIAHSVRNAVEWSKTAGCIVRDAEADLLWCDIYTRLSEELPGLSGALLARAEAHVMRLGLIYALLDQSPLIRIDHLQAALAVWDYVEASVRHIFGVAIGDPLADEILELLKCRTEGVTRTEIRDHFRRHQKADQLLRSLSMLERLRLARKEDRSTGGRPEERWIAIA